ncbi:phosphoserine phosphatase-like [Gordionus sp. m RMFG-2023]|uniref:phosphoserine phosphatase-like n=1 Tax=Gordionus sp. m RMFG-2023 TaxID=3053472 RepID=UPI0031FDA77C
MEGELKFEDSLEKRMNILSINQNLYNQFLKQNKLKLTINSQKFIQFLKEHDIPVYIISGGFSDIIHSLVKSLGIKKEMIFANNIIFDKYGNYLDFDRTKMTSYSGGKGKVIQYLKDEFRYQNIYIIGDGVTDLEACPPANGFIGFGGNVIRENVKNRSKWFIYDFQELLEE